MPRSALEVPVYPQSTVDQRKRRSFWENPTKVLTFFAALLGVITGIITLLSQLGAFGDFRLPFLPGTDVRTETSISLSRGTGPSGTTVTVTGHGFAANETIMMRFHVDDLGPAQADAAGDFTTDIRIPGTYDAFAPQPYAIRAIGKSSVRTATATFQLEAGASGPGSSGPASIGLSVGTGRSGTQVVVTGQNFSPGEEVTIRFHTATVGSATVDRSGTFSTPISIPGSFDVFAPQTFEIVATGRTSVKTATTPFLLTR